MLAVSCLSLVLTVRDSLSVLLDTGTISNGVFTGREANYTPPSSSAAKNKWSYSSIPNVLVAYAGITFPLSFFILPFAL
jgi:hypothetical protein